MKSLKYIAFSIFIAILSGCSTSNTGVTSMASSSNEIDISAQKPDYAIVKVLYATDRNQNSGAPPNQSYGINRASISYGFCEVSIPRHHIIGVTEQPSFLKLEFIEDPKKHVALLGVTPLAKNDFFNYLVSTVSNTPEKKTFIFVHGYNVSFAEAARKTAQIYYDLNIDMAPVFYSWPSQARTSAYTIDEQNAEWTQTNLKHFLIDFLEKSDSKNIYLIAHSMGNRILSRAVIDVLNTNPDYRNRIKEVILTAPDIDADVFKRDIAPALVAKGEPVTLYASSTDKALAASQAIHRYPRAGDSSTGLIYYPGIESIDATSVDTSFIGHSYPSEERSVLSDIFYLINDNKRASQRIGLSYIEAGQYWKINE